MQTRSEKNIKMKKVKTRRLNVSRCLVLILFLYILVYGVYYLYKEPVKHYQINGNTLISDADLLRELKLDDYPSYFSINPASLKKKLKNKVLIKDAKVSYDWNFAIRIDIDENRPMFIDKSTDQICLEDGTLIDYEDKFVGIPILLNSTPEDIMKTFAKNLSNIDLGIFYMINDIEYKPSYNNDKQVIDEYRFLLSMNDKNLVYVNAKRLKPLNRYLDVISTKKITQNGVFYLDGDESRYPFKVFGTTAPATTGDEVNEG